MLVLIGSKALNYYINGRTIRDIDLVASYNDATNFIKSISNKKSYYPISNGKKIAVFADDIYEIEIAWNETVKTSTDIFLELVKNDSKSFEDNGFIIPSLDLLYTLKMSHRYLRNSPHFLKTMNDIRVMRQAGAKIRLEHQEFFKIREKETYWYSHPKLNVTKDDFFKDDGVNYQFDHDSIHVAMKQLDKPAYSYFKPENSEVLCDRTMFENAPELTKLYAVLEEAMVLSIERSQVPHPGKLTPKQSFDMALMKVCTSITSGWFRDFSYENYDKVQELYSDDYVDQFWKAVEQGIVKKL